MSKHTSLILIFACFIFCYSTKSQTKPELTKIYSLAISDFIKHANKKNKNPFDTLFFGKRKNGQPDDFPDIQLPETIENTYISLVTPEVGTIKQKERKSRIYINMVGWVDKKNAEFILFVFSNGFEHQYNYTINYNYNSTKKVFELKNSNVRVRHLANSTLKMLILSKFSFKKGVPDPIWYLKTNSYLGIHHLTI